LKSPAMAAAEDGSRQRWQSTVVVGGVSSVKNRLDWVQEGDELNFEKFHKTGKW